MSRIPETPITMRLRAQAAERNLDELLTEAFPRIRNEWAQFSARGAVDDIGNQFHYKRSGKSPYSALEILMSSSPRYMLEAFEFIDINGQSLKWDEAVIAVRDWYTRNEVTP